MINIKKIKPSFVDDRGIITHILNLNPKIKTGLFIGSNKGAIRANHYHKKDVHYTYLLTGEFEYFEKSALTKRSKIEKVVVKPGDLVITPAQKVHSMKFTQISTMIVFTTEPRDQKHYEIDTVRVKLI